MVLERLLDLWDLWDGCNPQLNMESVKLTGAELDARNASRRAAHRDVLTGRRVISWWAGLRDGLRESREWEAEQAYRKWWGDHI